MKIEFKKIRAKSSKFSIERDGVLFSGEFKKNRDFVDIKGKLQNSICVACDRCGEEFMLKLNEPIDLKAYDGVFKGHIEDGDVIEFYDGLVDFDEILESEIESIKLDYHICDNCKKEQIN